MEMALLLNQCWSGTQFSHPILAHGLLLLALLETAGNTHLVSLLINMCLFGPSALCWVSGYLPSPSSSFRTSNSPHVTVKALYFQVTSEDAVVYTVNGSFLTFYFQRCRVQN